MAEKTYTVELTAEQIDVLASAAAMYEVELEDREDEGDPKATRQIATLKEAFHRLANSGVPAPWEREDDRA